MRVSVITATRNSALTVRDAIDSLASQTFKDFEHIVIDGMSSDSTLDAVRHPALAEKQRIVFQEPSGVYSALNRGLKEAAGDIVFFLHSDDALAGSEVLSRVVDVFEAESVDAVFGDIAFTARDDMSKLVRVWRSRDFEFGSLANGWMPPHTSFFMSRAKYLELGFFNTNYSISADYDAMLRYLRSKEITVKYLGFRVALMREGGASNGGLGKFLAKIREDAAVAKEHGFNPLRLVLSKRLRKIGQLIPLDVYPKL